MAGLVFTVLLEKLYFYAKSKNTIVFSTKRGRLRAPWAQARPFPLAKPIKGCVK